MNIILFIIINNILFYRYAVSVFRFTNKLYTFKWTFNDEHYKNKNKVYSRICFVLVIVLCS